MDNEKKRKKKEAELYGVEPPESVSYFEHVCEVNRLQAQCTRWAIAALIIFIALVVSNILWLRYEMSFEDVVVTQENADGYNNYIGNDGDIYNGEANNQDAQAQDGR